MYLIWSNEHKQWWRPDRFGYTSLVSQAGLYPREVALQICRSANQGMVPFSNPSEIAIPAEDVTLLGF